MSGTPLDSPALFRFRSVRLFKDVPNLNFSFRIKATAIWKFRFKITNCDLKFRPKKEKFQNVLKYIPDYWLGVLGTFSINVPYNKRTRSC